MFVPNLDFPSTFQHAIGRNGGNRPIAAKLGDFGRACVAASPALPSRLTERRAADRTPSLRKSFQEAARYRDGRLNGRRQWFCSRRAI